MNVYNMLPHSSLDMKSPWEVEKGTKPNVSMFKPFGCRATVFIGEDRKTLDHNKLSPRGVACIYLSLGFSRGSKSWLCLDPETGRLYSTLNVVFDETFMPARPYDQRVLGHYDTTPRTRMATLIHGSMDKAQQNYEEINRIPNVSTIDMIDNLEPVDKSWLRKPPCGRSHHPEADARTVIYDAEAADDAVTEDEVDPSDLEMTDDDDNAHHGFSGSDDESDQASGGIPDQPTKNPTAKPSGGITADSSKGKTAKTKRGVPTARSGGDSTASK